MSTKDNTTVKPSPYYLEWDDTTRAWFIVSVYPFYHRISDGYNTVEVAAAEISLFELVDQACQGQAHHDYRIRRATQNGLTRLDDLEGIIS